MYTTTRMTIDEISPLTVLSLRERQWLAAVDGQIACVGSDFHLVRVVGIHAAGDDVVWIQLETFPDDVAGVLLRCPCSVTPQDALSAVSRYLAEPGPRAYQRVNVVSAAERASQPMKRSTVDSELPHRADGMSKAFIRLPQASAAEPPPQPDPPTHLNR
jgi:hypothetical protein